jgi:AcrR family transcriptional regulator
MIMGNDRENRKNQILNAAFEVFVKKGYAKTTMDDIVASSNLSKGALYHYYKSKKELFLSLIDHWEIYTFKDFYDKKSQNKKASDILRFFGENVINTLNEKKHAYIAEIEFRAMSNQDAEIKKRSNILYGKLLELFEKVVKKGIKENEFKDLDVRKTSMAFLAIFQSITWFVIADETAVSADEYIRDSIELIIDSISK